MHSHRFITAESAQAEILPNHDQQEAALPLPRAGTSGRRALASVRTWLKHAVARLCGAKCVQSQSLLAQPPREGRAAPASHRVGLAARHICQPCSPVVATSQSHNPIPARDAVQGVAWQASPFFLVQRQKRAAETLWQAAGRGFRAGLQK